jgi:hypothetical protein
MHSDDYQELSLRTVPEPLAYWVDGFEGDAETARRDLMCNCALGLAGEATEIEETPTSDEIGDGYWYAYILLHVLGGSSYEPQPGDEATAGRTAHRSAGAVCELVKKHAFHGRDFHEVRDEMTEFVHAYVDALAALDDQPAGETFQQNVDKLRSRYPEGFFERG